ncbi:MAG: hypothetical protein BZ151_03355 [Desulfobacca sp. 4484_104]|nr:MAG: hypothetical protein BZ151_03355 [Desulfobacca sp. 4484_104]RLA90906.1 MAG: hypothetical protein DRG58_00930 [Deltaproteobacteria bacterium]
MTSAPGKKHPAVKSSDPESEEEIIELTEVISPGKNISPAAEGNVETLIELPPELAALDSINLEALRPDETENLESARPETEWDQPSLAKAEEPATTVPAPSASETETATAVSEPLAQVVEAHSVEQLIQMVVARFDDQRLQEIVAGVIQEVAERVCRELFPPIAEKIINREIEALKQSLEDAP